MVIEKSKIYGVDKVGSQDPTDIIRIDDATGLTYTSVNTGEIKSDFDRCYPWSDMREVMDDFGNVFVRIPKFYGRITKNTDGTYKHQISGYRYDGFTTLFIDGEGNELDYVDVGKYEGSMATDAYAPNAHCMRSVSGATCKVNITIGDFRKACMNNGKGYQQLDYLIWSILRELFLIEFATTDAQVVMRGYVDDNTAAIATGRTDLVATPSGSESNNTDGHHAMKYRGVENIYGNVLEWCDGISLKYDETNSIVHHYICADAPKYKDECYVAPYYLAIITPSFCGDTGCGAMANSEKFPLLSFPTEANSSDTTYYPDYVDNDCGAVLAVGGDWVDCGAAGFWRFNPYDVGSYSAGIGGRLCRKPL